MKHIQMTDENFDKEKKKLNEVVEVEQPDNYEDEDEEGGENEDAGCPFCGEDYEDCEHLLAVIDRTFGSCQGGYVYRKLGEFSVLIEETFQNLLKNNKEVKFSWLDYEDDELQLLWDEAETNSTPDGEDVYLDSDILTRMETQLLEAAGATAISGESDGGAPGMSSAMSYLYAENPSEVFNDALALLKEQLTTASK